MLNCKYTITLHQRKSDIYQLKKVETDGDNIISSEVLKIGSKAECKKYYEDILKCTTERN